MVRNYVHNAKIEELSKLIAQDIFDWQWPARGMNALATRLRLNEIVKVRHSLAHGFAMPGYSWTQAASGETRLTMQELGWTRAFFNHLVTTTDLGLRTHLVATYGVVPNW